ncbi:MAG: Calx-beta domain-containing protein [Bacteroidia bacterium]|nr:T9SS type A sorting domain-containing protein [Bacteroidia bacterium]MDW8159435.1 Calx-beta domain-containing protein [Bacteroidia bacterium]
MKFIYLTLNLERFYISKLRNLSLLLFFFLLTFPPLVTKSNSFDAGSIPAISFVESQIVVNEGIGILRISVTLDKAFASTSATVTLKAQNITPTCLSFQDFILLTDSLTFMPGDSIKEIVVKIVDDALIENQEIFYVAINSTHNLKIGNIDKINVVIQDNDLPAWTFTYPHISTLENSKKVILTLQAQQLRNSGTISLETRPGTAIPFKNYIPLDTTFSFSSQDSLLKIEIPILDNILYEDTLFFDCYLTRVSEGYILGYPSQVRVHIIDDDFKPNVQFQVNCPPLDPRCLADTTILEVTGNFENTLDLKVRLSYPWFEDIRVNYRTVEGTALENQNYLPVRGNLIFLPGDTLKQIKIPILNNLFPDPPKMQFSVLLTSTSPNAQLGFYNKFTVNLLDNDPLEIATGAPSVSSLVLYPNPATDIIHLTGKDLSNSQILLFNSYGQLFVPLQVCTENLTTTIFLPPLPQGFYFVQLREHTSFQTYTMPFVIH